MIDQEQIELLKLRIEKLDQQDLDSIRQRVARLEKESSGTVSDINNVKGDVGKVLEILRKIEIKLVGSIENDTPGLSTDVRQLKKDFEITKNDITHINENIQTMKNSFVPTQVLTTDVKELKDKVDKLIKFRWIFYGGLLVVLWIISNPDKILKLIKP